MDGKRQYAPTQWLGDQVELWWPRRLLVFGVWCTFVWVAVLLALFSTPTYEVTAILSMKPGPLSGGDADKFAASRPELLARPQITLLESETVIRNAIAEIGADRLYPRMALWGHYAFAAKADETRNKQSSVTSSVDRGGAGGIFKALNSVDRAYIAAKRNLRIRPEPQTDIIFINFRHPDPQAAVDFTNALVRCFTQRYFQVYSNAAAVSFFWQQHKQSDQAFARASATLVEFSEKYRVFQIEEQRRLLLQQRSTLAAALVTTRGSIAEKENQAAVVPAQLSQLKQPMARSSQLKALAPKKSESITPGDAGRLAGVADDPPLLFVRVYQDTVAGLVRLHMELAGLRALEVNQEQALKDLERELASLNSKEAEFEHLRLEITQAKASSELFFKKAFEEQLTQDLNEKKLSSVQVLQEATMPLKPISPLPSVLFAIGFILCLIPGIVGPIVYNALAKNGLISPAQSDGRSV